ASGFVGNSLLHRLWSDGFAVTAALRHEIADLPPAVSRCIVEGVHGKTYWGAALRGQEVVVHCAARVHVMRDTIDEPLEAFRAVNRYGTLNLARQAADAGVRRFV